MSGSSQLCQKSVKDPYFVQNWVQLCSSLPRSSNEKDIHKRLQTLWGAKFTVELGTKTKTETGNLESPP